MFANVKDMVKHRLQHPTLWDKPLRFSQKQYSVDTNAIHEGTESSFVELAHRCQTLGGGPNLAAV